MGLNNFRLVAGVVLAALTATIFLTCGEQPTDPQSQIPFEISKIEGYLIGDRLAGFKITGSGFTNDLEVDVDGSPMALNIQSDTLIEAALLDSIGEGEHTITIRKLSNSFSRTINIFRGANGKGLIWKGDLAAAPLTPDTNWAYRDTVKNIAYIYNGSSWDVLIMGIRGTDGASIQWQGSLPAAPASPATNWAYYNTTEGISYVYSSGSWQIIARDGTAGPTGKSIVWKGALATEPSSPDTNWAYFNTAKNVAFIYDGAAWDTMTVGVTGSSGSNGLNGISIVWKGALSAAPSNPIANWAYYNTSVNVSYLWDGDSWEVLCASSETTPLAPSGLTFTYDTLNGRVTLKWNRVNSSNVAGYIVYRNDPAITDIPAVVSGVRRLTDTTFVDQIFSSQLDPANHVFKYQVKTQDSSYNQSINFSSPALVSAPSPTKVRTTLLWYKIYPRADSASINDSVRTVISYANPTRKNVQIQWCVGHTDSIKATKAISALAGNDTLKYPWATAGIKKVYAKITDEAGSIWLDSTTVKIIQDIPTVVAGPDTTVSVSDSFSVRFSGSDLYGSIVKFRIDKDADGVFDDSATSTGTKRFKASATAANYNVVVQAQDDDANVKKDTMVLHVILDLPTVYAGADTTVSINDSFSVNFSGSDVYGSIVKFRIDKDGNGTFDDSATSAGTRKYKASASANNYNVIVQAQDDDANLKNDTKVLHVLLDLPTVYAGADTTVLPNDSFSVHFSGSDIYGSIVKFRIDGNGDGAFDDSATTIGTKKYKAPGTYGDYRAIVQALDDDGNIRNDTMALRVGLPYTFAAAGQTIQAYRVANGAITIDGDLTEGAWTAATVYRMDRAHNLVFGTVADDADCMAEFSVLWNGTGLYVGSKIRDDVHNAMNSQYLDAANIAYDDDGLEYWFDYNYDDAHNATFTSQALYYLQLVKGFGNLDPATQYGGWWGGDDGSGKGWSTGIVTVAQQQAMGWREVFTSDDGVNYRSELLVEWSGSIMHQIGTRTAGNILAMDIKVNDNDGGFTHEGALNWSDISFQTNPGLHWMKVELMP